MGKADQKSKGKNQKAKIKNQEALEVPADCRWLTADS
jgi:hypothetical protein